MSGAGGSSQGSTDDVVASLAAGMHAQLPPLLDRAACASGTFDRTPEGQLNSLSVVLGQEMDRWGGLRGGLEARLEGRVEGCVHRHVCWGNLPGRPWIPGLDMCGQWAWL